jgi:uncharacterized protein YndB with AHSA1/START domain
MTPLAHSLERTLIVSARPDLVFAYFTDSARFAAWWGVGSSIDARPGGAMRIRYPNGVVAAGEVVEIEAPRRMVFTYGYQDPAKGIPPGGSRVTITLEEVPAGTRLHLRHDLPDATARDEHAPGWRFQLSLFANVATREAYADVGATIVRFFTAWNTADAQARQALLAGAVTPDVTFRDPYAAVTGLDELVAHIGAVHTFMPGMSLLPSGEARQCQGTALCDWSALAADGTSRGAGTNVFTLAPDGRIAACVGFWKA